MAARQTGPVSAPVPPTTRTGLLVVGHGSRRPEANAVLEAVADAVAARLPDYLVRAAFLEIARPTVGEGFDALVAAGAGQVVVHPYFLYPGSHTSSDIPGLLAAAGTRHPGVTWTLTAPLNLDERIVEVVVDRVAAALVAP